MLKTTKSITLNGTSTIGGIQVVMLNATVNTEDIGNNNYNETVLNKDSYNKNKTEVRKDISDFKDLVYEVQDAQEVNGETQ